jgi:hypothetical protein
MRHLKAICDLRYGTRSLKAGECFEARPGPAKVLVRLGRAEDAPRHIAAPPPRLLRQIEPAPQNEELAGLRAEYTEKVGRRPFNGWDADTLREKIAAATPAVQPAGQQKDLLAIDDES